MRPIIAVLATLIVLQTSVLVYSLSEIHRLNESPAALIYCDDVQSPLVDSKGEE